MGSSRFAIVIAFLWAPGCAVVTDDASEDDAAGTAATSETGSGTGSESSTNATTMSAQESESDDADTVSDATEDTSAVDSEGPGTTTASGPPQVVMETTLGTIVIEFYPEEAPITVENFLTYVEGGFYDGVDGNGATIFHRVIPGFVIQGGGLTAELVNKATLPPIVNESDNGVANLRGTLSMARLPEPDTATSQFFVNVVDNPGLDATPSTPGYAVFGEVVEGMDVVDAIVSVPTSDSPPFEDVPVDPIVMLSVTLH